VRVCARRRALFGFEEFTFEREITFENFSIRETARATIGDDKLRNRFGTKAPGDASRDVSGVSFSSIKRVFLRVI
jgi:hypothetical protein